MLPSSAARLFPLLTAGVVSLALTVTVHAQAPATTTTLTLSASSVAQGTPVTLSAAVSGLSTVQGQVAFCDVTQVNVCTAASANLLAIAQVTPAAQARARLRFGPGTHSLVARFLGTTTAAASSASPASVSTTSTTNRPTTTVLTATALPQDYPDSYYTLNSTIFAPRGQATLSGTLTVTASTPSGNIPVTPPSPISGSSLVGPTLSPGPGSLSGNPGNALADFNEDGVPDLAVASSDGSSASFLAGNGDGTFAQPGAGNKVSGLCAATCLGLATADWNSDGHADIVALESTATGFQLHFAYGRGDGTFSVSSPLAVALPVGSSLAQLVPADYSGDGLPDLLIFMNSVSGSTLAVALQKPNHSFQLSYPTSFASPNLVPSSQIFAADLNGDGKADFVCLGSTQGAAVNSIFLSLGDGNFSATTFTGGIPAGEYTPDLLVLGDFNGDGQADLATLQLATFGPYALVQISYGDSQGSFTPAGFDNLDYLEYHTSDFSLGTLDINGDGSADVLVNLSGIPDGYYGFPSLLMIYLNGLNEVAPIVGVGLSAPYAVADLNGDGLLDIVNGNEVLLNQTGSQQASVTADEVEMPDGSTLPLTATFTPANGSYLPSNSSVVDVVGENVQTTITVSASPQVASVGQPVTLTATINPATTPDGYTEDGASVSFSVTSAPPIQLTATVKNGVASVTTTSIPEGSYLCGVNGVVGFNAPFDFAEGCGSVTITAAAPKPSSLSGAYTFRSTATITRAGKLQDGSVVGVLHADGQGGLTGEEDINSSALTATESAITGTYSLFSPNGGTLHIKNAQGFALDFVVTLNDFDTNGVAHTLTLLDSGAKGPDSIVGSGTAELETSTSLVLNNGTYTLALDGQTGCQGTDCISTSHVSGPVSLLGSLAISLGAGTLNGYDTFGVSGSVVENAAGTLTSTPTFTTQIVGPDASGRYTLMTQNSMLASDSPSNFVGYAVGPGKMYLISTDPHTTFSLLSGILRQQ